MLGITPMAIPLTFEHMKYPSIEEKMNNLWQLMNWQEHVWQADGRICSHHLKKDRRYGWIHAT